MALIDPADAVSASSVSAHVAPARPRRANPFHFAVWRWHFYAGLFVIPFLLILTLTGMAMMVLQGTTSKYGRAPDVAPAATMLSADRLAQLAVAAVPGGQLNQYAAPETPARPAYLVVKDGEGRNMVVAIDPYRGEVTAVHDKNRTLYAIVDELHANLLLGTAGDRVVEAAASLTILLIVTGLYLWMPGKSLTRLFVPRLTARGRTLWKELHGTVGMWIALILLAFCISGLAWAGVWGGKFVQPWSSFPLAKEAAQWSSTPPAGSEAAIARAGDHGGDHAPDTHAALGHGVSAEVPWALEQVPMPQSDGISGQPGISGPVTLGSVADWARANGFPGQFRVNVPAGPEGVYTIAALAYSEDGVNPTGDRTVHLDQYSGKVLADVRYGDYGLIGKAMAWGIGLHMGLAGTWNLIANFVILGLITLSMVSGVVMWWKRRPSGAGRLAAPPLPADLPMWRAGLVVVLTLSLAFPMAGITLLGIMAIDLIVLSRMPALRRMLN